MKNLFMLTSAAIVLGTASFAAGKLDRIAASYTALGYTNVQVTKSRGNVTVTAEKDGVASTFAAPRDAGKHLGKGKGKVKTKVKDRGTDGLGDDDGTEIDDDGEGDSADEGSDVETQDDSETN